ncbi:hypothetical protein ALC56_07179 [Trachymyrmex septentrionalis]|uniref:Uncharacterized protein n=1 Tax=Trachymyrmex septentrionalis TaxID=34720 RepID=A0A151JVZ9_9HYME|nr:hypothetical protein ALC56_07179 [Trachymyrmex septentrionalis]
MLTGICMGKCPPKFYDLKIYGKTHVSCVKKARMHRRHETTQNLALNVNLRFGSHSCPNYCGCGSLLLSLEYRGNAFPRLLGEYIVSYVSFSEIVAVRIRYVMITTRSIQ